MTVAESAPAMGRGDEVRPGETAPSLTFGPFTLSDLVRYAGASGDFNPMHFDRDLARSSGHPDVFATGMLVGSILGNFAVCWLAPLGIQALKLRFVDRVWLDEELRCGGEVVEVVEKNGSRDVIAKLWIQSVANKLKVEGDCKASSRSRASA